MLAYFYNRTNEPQDLVRVVKKHITKKLKRSREYSLLLFIELYLIEFAYVNEYT